MNTVLYYFSATGNSLTVAKDLAAEIPGARVVPITGELSSLCVCDADIVGVVFPVYVFGLPLIVDEFLRSLKAKKGAYVFTVATFGGLCGRAHTQAKNILKKAGGKLSSGFSVRMPGNYTPLYGAISEKKQERLFTAARIKVKRIASLLNSGKSGIFEEHPFILNSLFHYLLYKVGISTLKEEDRFFHVNSACVKCGLCQKVCPVSNIEMRDGSPVWLHKCQQCMACLQWCPAESIQYKKVTEGRRRYRHPGISSRDIIEQHRNVRS